MRAITVGGGHAGDFLSGLTTAAIARGHGPLPQRPPTIYASLSHGSKRPSGLGTVLGSGLDSGLDSSSGLASDSGLADGELLPEVSELSTCFNSFLSTVFGGSLGATGSGIVGNVCVSSGCVLAASAARSASVRTLGGPSSVVGFVLVAFFLAGLAAFFSDPAVDFSTADSFAICSFANCS